jgi:competence protein ComFC
VHALKYGGYLRVVEKVMAPLAVGVLGGSRFDAMVPVPLHRARLARCGFNQAELMARGVAGRIEAPVLDTLKVVRKTRDQGKLSAAEHRANVAGAYAARGPVAGKILLVDDVFTTGATLSECAGVECAGVLRHPGAGEVHTLALCRTVQAGWLIRQRYE